MDEKIEAGHLKRTNKRCMLMLTLISSLIPNHSKAKLMNVLKRSVTVMPVEITLHHLRASRPVARRLPRYSLVLPA